MVANKHITKIVIGITAIAAVLCLLAVAFSDSLLDLLGGKKVTMEYESKLFDTSEIISLNIIMDEEDWADMMENPLSEEYYVCDVEVNGTLFRNVAIRPKGNTSLSSIAMDPDSERYSFKLEFDHFVEGQTCFGLDKLILNNNYADATNMKEAIIYDMFQYLGADASLYNYAKVSVNDEYWGVYLALEAVEDSFMLRNYGTQDGELYKPDSMSMGADKSSSKSSGGSSSKKSSGSFPGAPSGDFSGGSFGSGDMPNFEPGNMPEGVEFSNMTPPDGANFGDWTEESTTDTADTAENKADASSDRPSREKPSGDGPSGDSPGGGFMGGFMGGGGANLNYNGDDLDNYSTIWNSEITGTGMADHRRVVTALENISEGTDLETYLDVENVLKYMAVHVFSVNQDSLSGSMAHNYYLYEYDGQLNILPWDYNLSLGGMSMGADADATEMVNDAIDTPFSGTNFFDALLEDEEYLAQYHEYLNQLVVEYVESGRFEEVYNRIRSQIDELVAEDPNALYNAEEYDAAAETLYEVITLRAESIKGQLDGTIPSTDVAQREDSSTLVDASHIDVHTMGEFNMGRAMEDEENSGPEERGARAKRMKQQTESESREVAADAGADANAENSETAGGPGEGFTPGTQQSGNKTLLIYAGCMALMLAALITVSCVKKRRISAPAKAR